MQCMAEAAAVEHREGVASMPTWGTLPSAWRAANVQCPHSTWQTHVNCPAQGPSSSSQAPPPTVCCSSAHPPTFDLVLQLHFIQTPAALANAASRLAPHAHRRDRPQVATLAEQGEAVHAAALEAAARPWQLVRHHCACCVHQLQVHLRHKESGVRGGVGRWVGGSA